MRPLPHFLRLFLAWGCLLGLATIAGAAFWLSDLRYSLPTPRPAGLQQPALGTMAMPARQVTLIHFFNPDCPCSRFNLDHVRQLAQDFRGRVKVVALLQTKDPQAVAKFGAAEPLFECRADLGGKEAGRLGVYSTPQAVVLDAEGKIFYRGNYNVSRYCTTRKTEFARLALEAALTDRPLPTMPKEATIAYGCALPGEVGA